MITLTESYIDALAPNDSAVKNGRGLVKKRSFVQLYKSEDGTLLFGECKGSGSSNYQCSADFIDPDKPVLRCSCPSRQFPCKHGLGLLYAYAGNETFEIAPIPEDILSKREKAEKREEQKAQKAVEGADAKPKKVNKSALKKKIAAQLEGLDLGAGDIHKTLHYRPYKAAKHIREEDSFFEVAKVKELYRYPGDLNRRVRWESLSSRPLGDADYTAIAACARRSYADTVKLVKNQLKNPLADKRPVLLMHVAAAAQTADGTYAIADEHGQYLTLGDAPGNAQQTTHLLPYLDPELLVNSAMLVMFHHGLDSGQLLAQPLSVIGQSRITRLLY